MSTNAAFTLNGFDDQERNLTFSGVASGGTRPGRRPCGSISTLFTVI